MFAMPIRPQPDFEAALSLMEVGRSDYEIARLIGVPRSTIGGWRHRRGSGYHLRASAATPLWRPTAAAPYCYLLGMYLGDGCIQVSPGGSASIAISLDPTYPGIVAETQRTLALVWPGIPANRILRQEGRVTVLKAYHPVLPFAFPQHGRGRKHLRPIALAEWQLELTEQYPRELLRGLIHSDGCRAINRFHTKLPSGRVAHYEYPRYFFSNLSADIRGILCDHCDLLGIRWTQSTQRNISIAHRKSVALLDEFVGPKA
jgi:hypothetical protein